MPHHLKIGCRPSKLALMQTEQAGIYICSVSRGVTFEKVSISTSGDRILGSLRNAGGKGLFVKEVDGALIDNSINLAIHCLKDVPGNEPLPAGTEFAGYLRREDWRDVLVCNHAKSILELPEGSLIGTSSPRRYAQLKKIRPDLRFDTEFRGSIDSRIEKVKAGVVDATILAAAGLKRADLWDNTWKPIHREILLPAIGQGTLVLQCNENDGATKDACRNANCTLTEFSSTAERTLLRKLNGDCHSAIAGICERQDGKWIFTAAVFSLDGKESLIKTITAEENEGATEFGERLAASLLSNGAEEILAADG